MPGLQLTNDSKNDMLIPVPNDEYSERKIFIVRITGIMTIVF